jgi:4-amino-4-deoxy-L-arabinose transferase-like glycosyltransferase
MSTATDTQLNHGKGIFEGINTKRLFLIGFAVILSLKLFFAAHLDLYSDEVFYWLASQHPALAYSDLPFMAALLAGLGSTIFGDAAIAVRTLFIIMGTLIPGLIFWIAKPLVGREQAWEASLFSLCLPLCAFLGLLAVPDVALLFFGLLFIGSLERATRLSSIYYWLLAGCAAALGISTHYRFALYLVSGFVYLLVFADQRKHWLKPGIWTATALLAVGFYPMLDFNFNNDLGGLDYHLLDRHPWVFQSEGLLHPIKQALLVTPFLYLLLLFVLFRQLKSSFSGDSRKGLIAIFAAVNLGVYWALAPWTDSTRTSIHWPLSGYIPLLVYLPETLKHLQEKLEPKLSKARVRKLIGGVLGIGFAGSLVALLGIGSQSLHSALQPLVGNDLLSTKMVGWGGFNQKLAELLESEKLPPKALIVTDNYYTGAQIELAQGLRNVYNIDINKAVGDGRAIQFALWQKDIRALRRSTGQSALFIVEDSTQTVTDKITTLRRACNEFARIDYLEQLFLLNGAKQYSFYVARDIGATGNDQPCPMPSLPWVDQPADGAIISATLEVSGWIINEGLGVKTIQLLVNGEVVGDVSYGRLNRADVVDAMGVSADPNAPNLGYHIQIPTLGLPNGEMSLELQSTGVSGEIQKFGKRTVTVLKRGSSGD